MTVTIVAVFFGLNFKILNLALPIFVPSRSPNGAINPPSNIKKIGDYINKDQRNKYLLEVVSLRESKTAEAIIVELNITRL